MTVPLFSSLCEYFRAISAYTCILTNCKFKKNTKHIKINYILCLISQMSIIS